MAKQVHANRTASIGRHVGRPSSTDTADVRRLLLDAAQIVLDTDGVDRFSLRECARRAGVSHSAPAHHFTDKSGLLTEFAAEAFDELGRMVERRVSKCGNSRGARFRETALAYIEFAIQNSARFQLMFQNDVLKVDSVRLVSSFQACHQRIYGAMAELLVLKGLPDERSIARMTMAWAAIHGFAVLAIDGGFGALFTSKISDRSKGIRTAMEVADATVREIERALRP